MELYRMQKEKVLDFPQRIRQDRKVEVQREKTAKSCVRVSRLHREKLLRCVIQMVLA